MVVRKVVRLPWLLHVAKLLLLAVATSLLRRHDSGMAEQVSEAESLMKMSRILRGNVTWNLEDVRSVMRDDCLDENLLLTLCSFLDGGKGGLLI